MLYYSDDSGKLFLIDTSTSTDGHGPDAHKGSSVTDSSSSISKTPSTPLIQIFFDDNIERDRAHIVDARDAHTFAPIPFSITENVFMKKVEPYFAITDPDYYVKLVEDMVDRQLDYLRSKK